ncbi:uncharacterized protein LOC143181558 [Calliopsis andreniformis]|uniref:uncharacterized protein LOC143181558 n=1 Tax=Calliopsis andreniformis TaxID=337506 RepID=UPI003FCCD10D
MDEELENVRSELFQLRKKCECTEMEIYDVNKLRDKGVFVEKTVERKYETIVEELKGIHCNYTKCIRKVNSQKGIDYEKIHSLTLQRDSLRKELTELKMVMDENNNKLTEIKKIISAQEVRVYFLLKYDICTFNRHN